ncbi:MAG: glycosyl transferase, partial [Eggerthellales bacterium]|nr:glycosyl transferase [Eggerthellales bacterium]
MMMSICSIFLRMQHTPESEQKRQDIWEYLRERDPQLYKRIRRNVVCVGVNLPTELGRRVSLGGYHVAQKIFKFN